LPILEYKLLEYKCSWL